MVKQYGGLSLCGFCSIKQTRVYKAVLLGAIFLKRFEIMAHRTINKKQAREYLKRLDTGQKSAVSLAMELATRLGVAAEFSETKELKWSQMPFRFNAKLGDICAVGVGSSKKEAKQNSAKELLRLIENESETDLHGKKSPQNERKDNQNPLLSSSLSDSSCSRNVVGELQNLAAKQKWELPEYEFQEPTGEDHSKTFTCLVKMMENLQCEGVGSTKKMAKKQAAEKMLDLLQGWDDGTMDTQSVMSPVSSRTTHSSSPETLDDSDLEDYYPSSTKSSPLHCPPTKLDFSDNFDVIQCDDNKPAYIRSSTSPRNNKTSYDSNNTSQNAKNTLYNNSQNSADSSKYDELAEVKLLSLGTKHGFETEYIELPSKCKKGRYQVFVKLKFNDKGNAPIVTFGTGETLNIAKCGAAERATKHLELMFSVS